MIGSALTNVLDALEFLDDKGLVTVDTPDLGDGRAYVWQEVRDKLQMDAAYFHGNIPVVYFKELQTVNEDDLRDLHLSSDLNPVGGSASKRLVTCHEERSVGYHV